MALPHENLRATLLGRILPLLLLAALFPGAVFSPPFSAKAQSIESKYHMIAAMTFSAAKFIEWPGQRIHAKDQPFFTIGVNGSDLCKTAFSSLEGKSLKGKAVRVIEVHPDMDYRDLQRCQIIFSDHKKDAPLLLSMTSEGAVLTVSNLSGFAKAQGCVQFSPIGDRLVFDINLEKLRAADLGVNTSLLQLARQVYR